MYEINSSFMIEMQLILSKVDKLRNIRGPAQITPLLYYQISYYKIISM